MSLQRYDAQNSYITLGNQLLLANQMLQQLMVSENTFDRVNAIRDQMSLLEGMLSSYYPFMNLEYFDETKNKMVKIIGYEKSMQHITSKLKENETFVEDRMTRGKYVYWLNKKYQLLSSCYGKLKLVPELSGGADMGAVEDQIPDEVSQVPNEEDQLDDEYPTPEPPKKKAISPKPLSELEKIKLEYEKRIADEEKKLGLTKKGKTDADNYDEADFELEDEPTAE